MGKRPTKLLVITTARSKFVVIFCLEWQVDVALVGVRNSKCGAMIERTSVYDVQEPE